MLDTSWYTWNFHIRTSPLTQHESDTKRKTLNYTFEKRRKGENKNFAFSFNSYKYS